MFSLLLVGMVACCLVLWVLDLGYLLVVYVVVVYAWYGRACWFFISGFARRVFVGVSCVLSFRLWFGCFEFVLFIES